MLNYDKIKRMRPYPTVENKKVIGLMKNERGSKITKHMVIELKKMIMKWRILSL